MTISVTSNDVQGIIEVRASINLTPFIDAAIDLVTELCMDCDYSDSRLNRIATWLSAHFYAIREGRPTQERADGAGGMSYQSKVDLGFDVTHYGQMAMRLDTAGGLAALNQQAKKGGKVTVGVSHLGMTKTEIAQMTITS